MSKDLCYIRIRERKGIGTSDKFMQVEVPTKGELEQILGETPNKQITIPKDHIYYADTPCAYVREDLLSKYPSVEYAVFWVNERTEWVGLKLQRRLLFEGDWQGFDEHIGEVKGPFRLTEEWGEKLSEAYGLKQTLDPKVVLYTSPRQLSSMMENPDKITALNDLTRIAKNMKVLEFTLEKVDRSRFTDLYDATLEQQPGYTIGTIEAGAQDRNLKIVSYRKLSFEDILKRIQSCAEILENNQPFEYKFLIERINYWKEYKGIIEKLGGIPNIRIEEDGIPDEWIKVSATTFPTEISLKGVYVLYFPKLRRYEEGREFIAFRRNVLESLVLQAMESQPKEAQTSTEGLYLACYGGDEEGTGGFASLERGIAHLRVMIEKGLPVLSLDYQVIK